MRKGILEFCVLELLSHGKMYPSDILKRLKEVDMLVVEGTLYTLLNRLKREGKLQYIWEESKMGPPRKYFYLTETGKQHKSILEKEWDEINNAIMKLRQ